MDPDYSVVSFDFIYVHLETLKNKVKQNICLQVLKFTPLRYIILIFYRDRCQKYFLHKEA